MLHHDLPIHKTGRQLMALAFEVHRQLPRDLKRGIGDKVQHHCIEMLDLMAMANATKGASRAKHIEALLHHQRTLTVIMRVGHDVRAISTKLWAQSVQLLDSIGKQGGGWLKHASNKAPAA